MSARTLCVCSWKGGVGKTTTVQHVGYAMALRGRRVLMVDLDPMMGLTTACGVRNPARTITDVFEGRCGILEAAVEIRPNLRIVPSDTGLAGAERALQDEVARELFLKEFLASVDADFVLLDTPPSLGILTLNAFAAAEGSIVALDSKFLSLQGLAQVLDSIAKVQKKINPRLQILGVAPTMFTRTIHAREVAQEAADFVEKRVGRRSIFPPIAYTVKFADASFQGKTVFEYAPDYEGAKAYETLAEEVLKWSSDGSLYVEAWLSSTEKKAEPPSATEETAVA